MPVATNIISVSKSPVLQVAVKSALLEFVGTLLTTETAITTPTAGYKMYDKRVACAKQVILNPDLYVEAATRLVAMVEPQVETNGNATYDYLRSGNPMGQNAFNAMFQHDAWSATTSSTGQQIFDVLAGVNQSDLI